jgi:hypothetical protein
MPWKECHIMDERLRFVARLLEGEKMAPLCAEFGISRKTGYKIFDRYKDCGLTALSDRSPHSAPVPPMLLPTVGGSSLAEESTMLTTWRLSALRRRITSRIAILAVGRR